MRPPQVVYRFVIVFIFQKLLQAFNRPGMQATRPALRLADLGARLFQGLVLEVVALEQFSLFFRQLLDGPTHPPPHLLELNALVRRQGVVGHLHGIGAVEAGPENHGEAGDGVRDALHLVFEAPAAAFTIGEVAEVGVRSLGTRARPFEHPHLAEAVVDGALDAVVSKGEEVGTHAGVEAFSCFEQADLAPRDELFHLELGVELLAHLGGERTHVGAVLFQDLRLGFRERQRAITPLAPPCSTGARESGPGGDRL